MGIFKRISDIFRSNVHDALDKAEDPEKMIKLMLVDMKESMNKSTAALAKAMAHTKQMENKYKMHEAASKDWENKARAALQAGKEDLAKSALERKAVEDQNVAQYKAMYEQSNATTEKLKEQHNALKKKYEEAKMKESMLIARSQNAEAQAEIAKNVGGMGNSSFADFSKFEEKIMAKEAEAEAYTGMNAENVDLDQQFAELEKTSTVDDELAKLKASMNQ